MTRAMPVLVTGATGFIGSHLVRRLASSGHDVRALDVRSATDAARVPGVVYHEGDIRDEKKLGELLSCVDTLYHLASVHLQVHASEREFESVNVKGVERLVELCVKAGVRRMVHTSSVGIYGHVERPPASEGAAKRPLTAYERTKLAGETAALGCGSELGLGVIVLRPAWVYGTGCPRTAKLARALRKRRFFYIGSGSNLRHPLYVEDMIDAYELAASCPDSLDGRGYIIAGPRSMTLRQMVDTFARVLEVPAPSICIPRTTGKGLCLASELAFALLGRDPPVSRRSLAFFENDNAFDTGAAERDLRFKARVELEDGLRSSLNALN